MSQQVIKGTKKLSETIRSRRIELGLTIEEAAYKAGVGMKTWCRYEAGESIRKDKAKGICKALNWRMIPDNENKESDIKFHIGRYMEHEAWSKFICDCYGEAAAISFVIGSDILLDYLEDDLQELSMMPKGTHLGQLPVSMMKEILPKQFLMRYDYEFLYCFQSTIKRLRQIANYGSEIIAHSVMQELALYLIVEEARFLMESMSMDMEKSNVDGLDMWEEWIFDVFDDMDIETCLYCNDYLTEDHIYHFTHWQKEQFYTNGNG